MVLECLFMDNRVKYSNKFVLTIIEYCTTHTMSKAARTFDVPFDTVTWMIAESGTSLRDIKKKQNQDLINKHYNKLTNKQLIKLTGWSKTKFYSVIEQHKMEVNMSHKAQKSQEVNIKVIAGSLPLNTWFDKYEFAALTGVRTEVCAARLKELVSDKLLMVHYTRGIKSRYKMTDHLKEKMLSLNAAKEAKSLDPKNIELAVNRMDIDKLLFSTKFF
jgi:hypothetical protein